MVLKYKDIFRIRLGADPPVNIPPMEIKFEYPERPVKVRQRTYSPEQLDFIKKKCDELLNVATSTATLRLNGPVLHSLFRRMVREDFVSPSTSARSSAETKKACVADASCGYHARQVWLVHPSSSSSTS